MRLSFATATTTIGLLCSNVSAWIPTSALSRLSTKSLISGSKLYSTIEERVGVVLSTKPTDVEQNSKESVAASSAGMSAEYRAALEQGNQMLKSKIPEKYHSKMIPLLSHFLEEYLMSAQRAHEDKSDEFTSALTSMQRFLKGVGYALQYGLPNSPDYYRFDVTHLALRGQQMGYQHVDYYAYGCNFFRHCMDFNMADPINTHVLGFANLQNALEQLKNGENVIFLANHQSEADPQVVSLCFELCGQEYADAAAEMVYVAGHKVTTDPLAIPFSMGRNLLCIHSKKHIDSDPDTKSLKQKQNLKAMNALLSTLKDEKGRLVWVAPSGGRDRRDVATNTVPLAPFDSKTLDMFRLMGNKSRRPVHYYTMAMVSYDLCPPPDTIEAGTGEQRNVRYVPVGIKIGKEVPSVGGLESRGDFCKTAMDQCTEDYNELLQVLASYSKSKQK